LLLILHSRLLLLVLALMAMRILAVRAVLAQVDAGAFTDEEAWARIAELALRTPEKRRWRHRVAEALMSALHWLLRALEPLSQWPRVREMEVPLDEVRQFQAQMVTVLRNFLINAFTELKLTAEGNIPAHQEQQEAALKASMAFPQFKHQGVPPLPAPTARFGREDPTGEP
jgi:hypothetical protein